MIGRERLIGERIVGGPVLTSFQTHPAVVRSPIARSPTRSLHVESVASSMASEPNRTYMSSDPVRTTYVEGHHLSTFEEHARPRVISREIVRHPLSSSLPIIAEPVHPAAVTYVHATPETTEAEWIVVEKTPKTIVRHNVVDQVAAIRTPDGRYIIGETNFGLGIASGSDVFLSEHADGILRLPDGRIKYADEVRAHAASPSKTGLQGSIVALSDGSVLLPDGTIEYADGTIRQPTSMTYSAGMEFAWGELKTNNQNNLATVSEEISKLKEEMQQELEDVKAEKEQETRELKERLVTLTAERQFYEQELAVLKQGGSPSAAAGPGGWAVALDSLREELHGLQGRSHSPQYKASLQAKEDHLRALHEQFLAEARANAEARGLLQALQEEKAKEAETRKLLITEAVLRKEQEMAFEKDRVVRELTQRSATERETALAQERRQREAELGAERRRAQQDVEELQAIAEAERKRADDEQERAIVAEQQLAVLTSEKSKKKKKKGKKKAKGKAKAKPVAKVTAKAKAAPIRPVGVIRAPPRLAVKTTAKAKAKAPAKRPQVV